MIYHLTTQTIWENAEKKGIYEVESILIEGFIHASKKHQVARSANVFFKDNHELFVLHIDENLLAAPLKYETATDTQDDFPHIYGSLNLDAVIKVEEITKNKDNLFQF